MLLSDVVHPWFASSFLTAGTKSLTKELKEGRACLDPQPEDIGVRQMSAMSRKPRMLVLGPDSSI